MSDQGSLMQFVEPGTGSAIKWSRAALLLSSLPVERLTAWINKTVEVLSDPNQEAPELYRGLELIRVVANLRPYIPAGQDATDLLEQIYLLPTDDPLLSVLGAEAPLTEAELQEVAANYAAGQIIVRQPSLFGFATDTSTPYAQRTDIGWWPGAYPSTMHVLLMKFIIGFLPTTAAVKLA